MHSHHADPRNQVCAPCRPGAPRLSATESQWGLLQGAFGGCGCCFASPEVTRCHAGMDWRTLVFRREGLWGWGTMVWEEAGGGQSGEAEPCPDSSPMSGPPQPEESVGLRAEGHPDSLKDNSSCSVMVRPPAPPVSPPLSGPPLAPRVLGPQPLSSLSHLSLAQAASPHPCSASVTVSVPMSPTQHLLPAPSLVPCASQTVMTPDPCLCLTSDPALPHRPPWV